MILIMKSASFKCLPSAFVNGANNFTTRSSLFTRAQETLEFKINKKFGVPGWFTGLGV